MIPSKVFDYMGAGSAIVGICDSNSELKKIIEDHRMGVHTEPEDVQSLVETILRLYNDVETLNNMKKNARNAAVTLYSSKVGQQKIKKINSIKLP